MVLSKDDLMKKVKDLIGDKSDDVSLSLIEDINDTYDDLNNKDSEDWKKKYEDEHKKFEDNDKQWREKYRDRFFNGSDDENSDTESDDNTPDEENKSITKFEDLFKEE